MNSSAINYNKLYLLQDKTLDVLKGNLRSFYLTGGTALGRYYLHHRFSDDLDFFVNQDGNFKEEIQRIYLLLQQHLMVDTDSIVNADEFVRIWIGDETRMKLEFVNDVATRVGETIYYRSIPLDNPLNILANKFGAMLSRDETKDIFDIVTLAEHYAFNWEVVYRLALKKHIMNEQDVLKRITTFPVSWLPEQRWLKEPVNTKDFKQKLDTISRDFLFGNNNSLGTDKPPIEEAKPQEK